MASPLDAYTKNATISKSPRDLEALALMRSAARLKNLRDHWNEDHSDLDGAIGFNRKLWTILSTAATETDSPLPPDMQRNIAMIAMFIFNRSLDAIVDPKPEHLDALIDINRNIASGLYGTAPDTAA